jgi:predicted TIM-barrel fold metal-dependent hydrolase
VLQACVETDTVACLHVGSSGMMDMALDGPLVEIGATLFSSLSLTACVDWLWSGVALRFPELRIAMSEGGIGWVPLLADRLDYIHGWSGHGRKAWPSTELTPTEVLLRNFWFCSLDDPSIWPIRDRIGVDHIMVEVDYPHADSSWPDTQELLRQRFAGLTDAHVRKMTHENAARLFRHPLPGDGWATAATE